jgi:hypothetical protein
MSRYRLPTDVVPSKYSLNVLPVVSSRAEGGFETFSGRVSIEVLFVGRTNKVVLNAKKLTVSAVTLSHGQAADVHGAFHFDEDTSQLLIAFKVWWGAVLLL